MYPPSLIRNSLANKFNTLVLNLLKISIMLFKITLLTLTALRINLTLTSVPLTLGITIFIIALTSLILICIISTTWLALSFFLIYIGGILVLFAYFLAILPNQFLNRLYSIIFSLLALAVIGINEHQLLHSPQWSYNQFSVHLILSNQNTVIVITLALSLLLVLIITVKLTIIKSGPLRPYSYPTYDICSTRRHRYDI